jgi:DNA-binding response OmpR family regulator
MPMERPLLSSPPVEFALADRPPDDRPEEAMSSTGTLLVAGDTLAGRGDLAVTLGAAGYHVRMAGGADQALTDENVNGIDMVLVDLGVLGEDGVELCRRLTSREQTRYIPVIAVGPRSATGWRLAGLVAGAADIVEKPLHKEELLACVRLHLELARLQNALQAKAAQLRRASDVLRWGSAIGAAID